MFVPALELRSFLLGGALTLLGSAIYLIRPENRTELLKLSESLQQAKYWIYGLRRARMRVLIIDGGRQGRSIADRLLAKDEYRLMFRTAEHQITFIEEKEERCQLLEKRFSVPVYQGDGTKKELLEQVGVENVDVAIAASEDDGRNVIVALQAKRLGMKQVIAIVQDPEYIDLLQENDIVAISSPWATAAMVENFLDRPGVAQLLELGTGVASLLGVTVQKTADVIGKRIRELELPYECVIAAVIRGTEFVVPRGDTLIEADQRVILVGPTDAIKKAQAVFLRKA
jgi:Trk K+ transport system NAD-binding subunit